MTITDIAHWPTATGTEYKHGAIYLRTNGGEPLVCELRPGEDVLWNLSAGTLTWEPNGIGGDDGYA